VLRRQEKKRKISALVTPAEPVPKSKKVKVLTHRPRYIEPAVVPEFGAGSCSEAEATETDPIAQSTEEATVMPKVPIAEPVKDKVDKAEESKVEKIMQMPKILSPPTEATLPKMQKASSATPKRRRMANILDAVLQTTKVLSPATAKKIAQAEANSQAKAETGQAEAEATQAQGKTEAGPSVPTETKLVAPEEKTAEQIAPEKIETHAPEDLIQNIDFIIRHASGKKLSEEEILEARHYARKLKYSKGALVFNGSNEDDFLYCLPDNKEISVCREIGRSMGFPKLEDGLSILSKDDLADNLAYNSMKV
jgi:hypothetical protein